MSQDIKNIIRAKATELKMVKDTIDEKEEELKALKATRDKLELFDLPQLLENAEIESVKFEGIGTVYTQTKPKVSVLAQDKPAFFDWLEGNGHGDIIKRDVHYQTLNVWAKEILEQGLPTPSMCSVHYETRAVIRRK